MTVPSAVRLALLPILAIALAGCAPPASAFFVVDNFSDALLTDHDDVADIYAQGSQLSFTVGESGRMSKDVKFQGWSIVSSDPAVITLSTTHAGGENLTGEGSAVGPGTAQLAVVSPDGNTVHTVDLEVAAPDTVTLVSKLGTDVGSGFAPTNPQEICIGAYSAFEARFSASGRSLASSHVLGANGSDTVSVRVEDSSLWEDREWMSVWPTLAGDEAISVLADGSALADVPFKAVDTADVVGLQVIGNTTGVGVANGDTVLVGAVGLDAAGAMVLGVTPSWVMPDGTQMVGDELSYTADNTVSPVSVRLTYGSVVTTTTIAGFPKDAQQSSAIGCASVRGVPALGAMVAGLLLVAGRRRSRA